MLVEGADSTAWQDSETSGTAVSIPQASLASLLQVPGEAPGGVHASDDDEDEENEATLSIQLPNLVLKTGSVILTSIIERAADPARSKE